jgi:hypothetical protein
MKSMTYEQLVALAGSWNKDRTRDTSIKKVEVLDVLDQTAVASPGDEMSRWRVLARLTSSGWGPRACSAVPAARNYGRMMRTCSSQFW